MGAISRRWKWMAGIVLGFFAVLFLGTYVFISQYDVNRLKPEIRKAVRGATGLDLILGGEMTLAMGFSPRLSVERVQFRNPGWDMEKDLARIKTLRLQVALMPLINGELRIKKLVLIEPEIELEIDPNGRWNFQPTAEQPAAASEIGASERKENALPLLSFHDLKIERGLLTFMDGRNNRMHRMNLRRFEARTKGLFDPIRVTLEGLCQNHPFKIGGTLGPMADLWDPKKRADVTLEGEALGTRFSLAGHVGDVLHAGDFAVRFSGEAPSTGALAEAAGKAGWPDLGPLQAAFNLTKADGRLTLDGLRFHLGEEERAALSLTGDVQDLRSQRGLDVRFSARGHGVEPLEAILGRALPCRGFFEISGHATDPLPHTIEISNFKVLVGKNGLAGLIRVRLEGGRPHFKAQWTSRNLDLRPLLSRTQKEGKRSVATGFSPPHMPTLPPEWATRLRKVDAALDLRAECVVFPDWTLKDCDLHVRLDKGQAAVKHLETRFFRGSELAGLRLTARLPDIRTWERLGMTFDVQGQRLDRVCAWLGRALPLEGSFHLKARAGLPESCRLKISPFDLCLGKSDLAGSLDLNLNQARPHLRGTLTSRRLDLRPWLKRKGTGKDVEKGKTKKVKVLSSEPLPLSPLKRLDGDVSLKAESVLLPHVAFEHLNAHALLKNGDLSLKDFRGIVGGGFVSGRLSWKQSGKRQPLLETAFKARKVAIGPMLRELDLEDLVDGDLDAEMTFKGRGRSVAALASGADGVFSVVVGAGQIQNRVFKYLGADLGTTLMDLFNPLDEKADHTRLNCAVGRFEVKDGLVASRAIVVDTERTSIVAEGELDLKTEGIDLRVSPSPKGGVGISGIGKLNLSAGELAKPFKLSGTLAHPTLSLDATHTLITLGKALGGILLFGPVGIAAILASGHFGDENPCVAALEEATQKAVEKSAPQPREWERGDSHETKIQESGRGAENSESLGGFFKKLFKK